MPTTQSDSTVTVVVCCHDPDADACATCASVRRQSYKRWECLVVDDATGCVDREARRFVAKDARFKLVRHQAAAGATEVHNTGLRLARGELVWFVDAGVELASDALEQQLGYAVLPDTATLRAEGGLAVDAAPAAADILFLPHKDYHVWTIGLIAEALRAAGIHGVSVDLSAVYGDEGARAKLGELELPHISYNQLALGAFAPRLVVCMNDWEPINRRIIQCCRQLGIPTVGVVEGVQDYLDADTGQVRSPYRGTDYVLLPGAFDRRYFSRDDAKIRVCGVPRIDELLAWPTTMPARPLVVINVNFSYGVQVRHRDAWVDAAVGACHDAGYDYVISRHPADRGDLSDYHVGDDSMYDLIARGSVFVSRFGSGILEALAMAKPAIYFNPHGEKIDKFTEPGGAYPISRSRAELAEQLRQTITDPQRFLAHAADFIELHCGTRGGDGPSGAEKLATAIIDIYRAESVPEVAQRARLGPLLMQTDRQRLGKPSVGEPEYSLGERLVRLGRKYRKLRRDPRKFVRDATNRPLGLLRRLIQP